MNSFNDLAKDWESEALKAEASGIQVVLARFTVLFWHATDVALLPRGAAHSDVRRGEESASGERK